MIPLERRLKGPAVPIFIGQPYHGVAIDGVADLSAIGGPNSLPTDHNQGSARVVPMRNPNRVLPTRTEGQQEDDAEIGRVYTDEALIVARTLNGAAPGGVVTINDTNTFIYCDSRGYPWWARISMTFTANTALITGSITFRRIFRVGSAAQPAVVTLSGIEIEAGGGPEDGQTRTCAVMDWSKDGSRVLIGTNTTIASSGFQPFGFWELEISDDPIETGGTYPYGGGTIEFKCAGSVVRARSDMLGGASWNTQINSVFVDRNNESGANDPRFGDGDFPLAFLDGGPDVWEWEITDRYFWASYDQSGAIVQWSLSASGTQEIQYTFLGGGIGGTHSLAAEQSEEVSISLRLDGVDVYAKTINLSRSYSGQTIEGGWDPGESVPDPRTTAEYSLTSSLTQSPAEWGADNGNLDDDFTDTADFFRFPDSYPSEPNPWLISALFSYSERVPSGLRASMMAWGWIRNTERAARAVVIDGAHISLTNAFVGINDGGEGVPVSNSVDVEGIDSARLFSSPHLPEFAGATVEGVTPGLSYGIFARMFGGNRCVWIGSARQNAARGTFTTTFANASLSVSHAAAPDSNEALERTPRDGATISGPFSAYNPWHDEWSHGAWKPGDLTWEVRHYF